MKLSEAIRAGRERFPDLAVIRHDYFSWNNGELCGACAGGFGLLGVETYAIPPGPYEDITSGDLNREADDDYRGLFPGHNRTTVTCPVEDCLDALFWSGTGIVTHLNDDHSWSLEQIANYLEEQGL